jgi:hypothetical protein
VKIERAVVEDLAYEPLTLNVDIASGIAGSLSYGAPVDPFRD